MFNVIWVKKKYMEKPSQLYNKPAVKLIQIYNKGITVSSKTKHTQRDSFVVHGWFKFVVRMWLLNIIPSQPHWYIHNFHLLGGLVVFSRTTFY